MEVHDQAARFARPLVRVSGKGHGMIPLEGVKVLDFSTLLPGPLAALILAEAGAEVTKVERPGAGDGLRSYAPKFGASSANFALLNRGKKSLTLDLKSPEARERLVPLIEEADVLVEQFRPGVMDRFGLGYADVSEINPGIVYCSITGYGQTGPKSGVAAHDLNYVSDAGLLGIVRDSNGSPVLPPALVADIGGGSYPAVMNILLALLRREKTGRGAYLDISMSDNVLPFLYWAIGAGTSADEWPEPGGELLTGGSPRYNLYRTSDDEFVAAAPLEEHFWQNFCDALDLPQDLRDDAEDPEAIIAAVAARVAEHPAEHWREVFRDGDVCCSVVRTVREAMADEHFNARGLFDREVEDESGRTIPATPLPLAPGLQRPERRLGYPAPGNSSVEPRSEGR